MSLNAAAIEILIGKGLSASDLLDVARAMERRSDPTAAERKRRQRDREMSQRDVTRDPPNDNSSNPPGDTSGANAPSVSRKRVAKPEIFVCPEGVDPKHWADFLANRKRKKCAWTETAHQTILDDLASLADNDWPPGRLVKHAAGKGWASINDPRNSLNGQHNGRSQPADPIRGHRPDPAIDMLNQASAEIAAQARNQEADLGTWLALPSFGSG